jgi:hypothetical protein
MLLTVMDLLHYQLSIGYALWLQLPLLDSDQDSHPGKNWQKFNRQGKAVGNIMIASRTKLKL